MRRPRAVQDHVDAKWDALSQTAAERSAAVPWVHMGECPSAQILLSARGEHATVRQIFERVLRHGGGGGGPHAEPPAAPRQQRRPPQLLDLGTARGTLLEFAHASGPAEGLGMPWADIVGLSALDHRPPGGSHVIPDESYRLLNIDCLREHAGALLRRGGGGGEVGRGGGGVQRASQPSQPPQPPPLPFRLIWSSATFYHLVDPVGALPAVFGLLERDGGVAIIRHVPLALQLGIDDAGAAATAAAAAAAAAGAAGAAGAAPRDEGGEGGGGGDGAGAAGEPARALEQQLEAALRRAGHVVSIWPAFEKGGAFSNFAIVRTATSPDTLELPFKHTGGVSRIGGANGYRFASMRVVAAGAPGAAGLAAAGGQGAGAVPPSKGAGAADFFRTVLGVDVAAPAPGCSAQAATARLGRQRALAFGVVLLLFMVDVFVPPAALPVGGPASSDRLGSVSVLRWVWSRSHPEQLLLALAATLALLPCWRVAVGAEWASGRGPPGGHAAWANAGGAVALLGWGLRRWAKHELAALFTYQITAPGELLTTGPYRWLVHPGYAGSLAHSAGMVMLATVALDDCSSSSSSRTTTRFGTFSPPAARLPVLLALCAFAAAKVLARIEDEEAMLREHFGGDRWAAHVSARWRLLPLVF